MNHTKRPFQPIENYGIIGNLKTVALVSLQGSIDFMCAPNFDSPTVFATMLDSRKGGFFAVEPDLENFTSKQLYLPGTAILLTRYFSDAGIAELTDFMPIEKGNVALNSAIVRQIKTVRGSINFKVSCVPRFGYSESDYETECLETEIKFICKKENLQINMISDKALKVTKKNGYSEFTLEEGEVATIVIEFLENGEEGKDFGFYKEQSYHQTKNFWIDWINKTSYSGRYSELIRRSVITLKLLTSVKHGSVVAAPTFGFPEAIGGNRNWDYRYTWIRDAAFTMYAFLKLGFNDEATAFIDWIFSLCQQIDLQLVYQ
ncbi:MAG: glycoside hydrolase family 15 protein, partial [Pedobacter sp.]